MNGSYVVVGTEVRIVIDARGELIHTSTRSVTADEVAGLFASHERRATEVHARSGLQNPVKTEPRTRRPSERKVDELRGSEADRLDDIVHATGADRDRVAQLVVEFGWTLVSRAVAWMQRLIDKGEEIRDPTGMLVSQVTRWGRED